MATLLIVFSLNAKALQCKSLFENHADFNDVIFSQDTQSQAPANLFLRMSTVTEAPAAAATKIIKHAIQSPSFSLTDKNFLAKDEIILNYNLKNKYSLEIVYKSDSREHERFVISEMSLRSPTNKKIEITEEIFERNEYKLAQENFDLSPYFEAGSRIEASIPFFIEGKTLDILERRLTSFELFSKDELRSLFTSKNDRQISRAIFLRQAKDIFIKVLVKEPFKVLLGMAVAFSVYTFQHSTEVKAVSPVQETVVAPKVLKEGFDYIYKKPDGSIVKLKVIARETEDPNRTDFKVQVVP